MKCKCGHRKEKHHFGSGGCETWVEHLDARQSKYCDCGKFQPEEEKVDKHEVLLAERFIAEQEHLRRRDLFERIAIKLLPEFVADTFPDGWIAAAEARLRDLLQAEESL